MDKSTQFKKGVSGNPNGRKKGVPNKATKELRETFKELLHSNLPKIQKDIDSLKPIERVTIIIQIAKFILPTLKAVDIRENETLVINFKDYNIPDIGNRTIEQ
jgi:hypothetical protein